MPLPIPGQPAPSAPNPAINPAAAHSGPGTMPGANQGNISAAMQKIRIGMKALEEALPMIPMGSPLHSKIHKVALDLAKDLPQGDENQALQLQSLVQMLRGAGQAQPMNALGRLFPGQQSNTPPATQSPGAIPPAQAA